MKNLFLVPISNREAEQNFEKTIFRAPTYDFLTPFLEPSQRKALSKFQEIATWGSVESKRPVWAKMKKGDHILFYKKKTYPLSARIVETVENKDLGLALWGVGKKKKVWPCIYFIDRIKKANISHAEIRDLGKYKKNWNKVQGLMPVNDDALEAIEKRYGSLGQFTKQEDGDDFVVDQADEDDGLADTFFFTEDHETTRREFYGFKNRGPLHKRKRQTKKVRLDNRRQMWRAKEIEDFHCQLCSKRFAWRRGGKLVTIVETDHILPKKDGGGEAASNLLVLCPNHHRMKTWGIIVFDVKKKKIWNRGKVAALKHNNHLHGWPGPQPKKGR